MARDSKRRNMVSVSWADHLKFGEADGRLASPESLAKCMGAWRNELHAGTILWRTLSQAPRRGQRARSLCGKQPTKPVPTINWNELKTAPQVAHEAGLDAYLYVSLFSEGWPLLRREVRERSYHNLFHGQHSASQTVFSRRHPEFALTDRSGRRRQWGVLCLAYPEVRLYFRDRILSLLQGSAFDGLFLCLRSESRPPDHADQFGYNEPIRKEFLARYGEDIWTDSFDLQAWHTLLGEYLTRFLREMRPLLQSRNVKLSVGVPRGDVIGPPLGNWHLDWRTWLSEGLVDQLIIDQNSSRCPSMWIDLWPMHRGGGYVQNYLTGEGMPPIEQHIQEVYEPVFRRASTELFLARQWHERDQEEERRLVAMRGVTGLVFSSFRHDNQHLLAHGDWWD